VDLSLPSGTPSLGGGGLRRAYIDGLLKSHGGKLTAAAKHADMDPKNFSDKLQRYGLRRSAPEPPSS
jgi:DNA-binding NtrC family response regulator